MKELLLSIINPPNTRVFTAKQLKQINARNLRLWNKIQVLEMESSRYSEIAHKYHRLNQQLKNQLDQNNDAPHGRATTRSLRIDDPTMDEPQERITIVPWPSVRYIPPQLLLLNPSIRS